MKEHIPVKQQKLIYLKWHDAHSAGGWYSSNDLNKVINEERCLVEEIGWLVYEDKNEIVMCARRLAWKSHDPDSISKEFGLIQKIPKTWIIDRQEIKLKDSK